MKGSLSQGHRLTCSRFSCLFNSKDAPRPLRCRASTTIFELKKAISKLVGTPIEQQVLIHDGVRLKNDDAALAEVGITDIAEVELLVEIVPSGFKRPAGK